MRNRFSQIGNANYVRLGSIASAAAACALFSFESVSQATLIPNAISGVEGYAGSNADNIGSPTEPEQVMNGAAISVGNVNDSSTWTADDAWQHGWQQGIPAGTQNWIGADFGSVQNNLLQAVIWNTREVTARGSQDVNIYYATNPTTKLATLNGTGYTFPATDGWTLLSSPVIPRAPTNNSGAGTGSGPDDFINLGGISARYIVFQITSNYGDGGREGFSGIQFTVPEPSSIGLAGLGLIGLCARRRRSGA